MTRQLFGTDGVRGAVGELLTAELALGLARAAAEIQPSPRPRVLVIRDTRESGEMFEAAVAAGVAEAGGEALLGGVLPTPAAPLLLARHGLDLAVVISASHNPYADNGIKFFGADGDKLSDATELEIERALADGRPPVAPVGRVRALHGTLDDYLRVLGERFLGLDLGGLRVLLDCANGATHRAAPEIFRRLGATVTAVAPVGRVRALHGTLDDYLRVLGERFLGLDLGGLRVLLDCANGATHRAAPEIFRRLGATVTAVADAPDGRNINDGVGSTHIEALAGAMAAGDHDVGFAFDGDGDRVLAMDRTGEVVDGDELVALAALHLREAGRLRGAGVAVTVMTNYGFHAAMREAGVRVATTAVGDRYVLEALRERGWALGGEQSGHIIELGFAPSGDGIASALLTLEALGGRDLAHRGAMEKLPQRLVNVRVPDKRTVLEARPLLEAVERESAALEGRGRVLVRPSGTEELVRVMVEAPGEEEADEVCGRLVEAVQAIAGRPAIG